MRVKQSLKYYNQLLFLVFILNFIPKIYTKDEYIF